MIRATLFFDLTFVDANLPDNQRRFEAWRKDVLTAVKPHVDKVHTNPIPDYLVDLDSPKLPQLIYAIEQLRKQKVAKTGSGKLTERFVDDGKTHVEWYVLRPAADFADWGAPGRKEWPALHCLGVPTTKADSYRPGVHALSGGGCFVSEHLKSCIEQHGLTGVEFLWVPDRGKYAAPQWYLTVAAQPLGRGLDHPSFDPGKFVTKRTDRRDYDQPTDPQWRYGITEWFSNDQFRSGAGYGHGAKERLLAMFEPGQLTVESFRRVLRGCLPETDFAYIWYQLESPRLRGLCINRKARDLLVRERLIREDECQGVLVVDRPDRGTEILDVLPGGPAGPGPAYSEEELAEIRRELQAWRKAFDAQPRPVRQPSLPRSLRLLKAWKSQNPGQLNRAASLKAVEKANEALPLRIPAAWEKVLRAAGGGRVPRSQITDREGACILAATNDLLGFQQQHAWALEALASEFEGRLLVVGETEFNDCLALDAGAQSEGGDCRVLLISHETLEVDREWDNTASFVEALLQTE